MCKDHLTAREDRDRDLRKLALRFETEASAALFHSDQMSTCEITVAKADVEAPVAIEIGTDDAGDRIAHALFGSQKRSKGQAGDRGHTSVAFHHDQIFADGHQLHSPISVEITRSERQDAPLDSAQSHETGSS